MAVISREQAASGDTAAREREWTDVFSSRWMLPVILLLTFVVYAPTLTDWFVADDFWFLRSSQSQPLGDYALRVFDFRDTGSLPELNRYRPLYPLAWKLQYDAFGTNAFPYHAVLLVAHLATVVLAWFVFRRLLDLAWTANLATLLFALHPAHADTVAWISSNRVFAGLPSIAALLLYMKFMDRSERWKWTCYAGSLLLYIAAVLMHSAAITLAAVLPLFAFFVAGQPRDALRWRAWLPFVPFFAVAAAYAAVQFQVRDQLGVTDAFLFGFHQFLMYGRLFGMLALPMETIEAGGLHGPIEKAQLLVAIAFTFLGFAVMYRRPMWGLGIFAWLWFLLALLPDSTFVAGASGRMLYTAGFAGALLLVLMMVYVRDLLPAHLRENAVAVAPYVLVLSIVPLAVFSFTRTHNADDASDEYHQFAQQLQREGPVLPEGGVLYIVNRPARGPFSPDSHVQSLVRLYYGDANVVIVPQGQPAPALGPNDRAFTFRP